MNAIYTINIISSKQFVWLKTNIIWLKTVLAYVQA